MWCTHTLNALFIFCCCCCFRYRIVRCACVGYWVLFRLRCIFAHVKCICFRTSHACNEPTGTHLQMQEVYDSDATITDQVTESDLPNRLKLINLSFSTVTHTPQTYVAHAYNFAIVSRIRNSMEKSLGPISNAVVMHPIFKEPQFALLSSH